jgi:predicted dehydrogenase
MSQFRWGILASGGIAKSFARDLQGLDGHVIAAVGSRSNEGAQAFAKEFPTATPYGSYEELVQSDVDAIYIASPHIHHAEHALIALNAGKPVLCEKAFTINASEAALVINRARELKLPLMEAIWTRFLPHIAQVRSIIESGVLGEITQVVADHGQFIPYEKAARLWEPALGGGALLDLGIYPLTIADIALGVPTNITASGVLTDKGVDLHSSAILTYQSGAQAIITSTMASRSAVTAVITGSKARLEFGEIFYKPTSMRLITREGVVTEYPNTYTHLGLREEAIEFARIVRAGLIESPLMTHSKTLEMMQVMDEIRAQIGVTYPTE